MIENGTYLAKTHPGLEPVLKSELEHAGASYIFESEGNIRFQAADEVLYTFLLRTRVCISFELILSQPVDVAVADVAALTKLVKWTEVIPLHSVFRVQAFHNGSTGSALRSLASELEKSICNVFQHTFESAPKAAGDEEVAEFVVNIQISSNGSCQLMLEAGGEVLHKRGRLHESNTAVVSPAMAAGLIVLSGWDGESSFIDPFANNGSFLIEAARFAKHRTPLFEDDDLLMKKWRTFRHALWKKKREEIVSEMRKDVDWILGSDSNYENISRIQYLSRLLRLNNNIKLRVAKPNTIFFPNQPGHILTAPPLETDIKLLGDFARIAKMYASGYKMGVFSSIANIDTIMGMKPLQAIKLHFNERDYTFMQFDIFSGKPVPTPGKKFKPAPEPGKTGTKPSTRKPRK